MTETEKHELDLRELEPPEPMIRILTTLEALSPGGEIIALLPRNPVYFLPRLEEAGHAYQVTERAPDLWELRITKA